MSSVNKRPSRNVGQAIRVLDLGDEGTMNNILNAAVTRRKRSREKPMESAISVSVH